MNYIHLIPFDKFCLDSCKIILESNAGNIIFIYGTSINYDDKNKLVLLKKKHNAKIYFSCSNIKFIQIVFIYFFIIIRYRGLKSIIHCTDIYNVKLFIILLIFFDHKYIWHIRGTDLYSPLNKNDNFFWCLINHFIYSRAFAIITNTIYDAQIAKNLYSNNLRHIKMIASPSNTLNLKLCKKIYSHKNNILIGNSATYSSRSFLFLKEHIQIIKNMQNYKFIFAASYGYKKYQQLIFEYSKGLNNIDVQTNFLEFNEFIDFLGGFNIAVLIPERLQGLGTLTYLLYFKCTIYTSQFSGMVHYLEQFKFNYKLLDNENQFLSPLEDKLLEENRKIVSEYFSYERCLKEWTNLKV